MSSDQKLKEGDVIIKHIEATNKTDLLFFSNMQQVYKTKASSFDDTKASVLGDYVPARLSFDQDELVSAMIATTDYSGFVFFVFENGKVAKVPLKEYETKTNRKKAKRIDEPKNGRTTRTPATVNRYMATLSIVLSFACNEYGWIDENPMRKVRKNKEQA